MGVFVGSVVLNASDNTRAATFWSQALGYVPGSDPAFLAPVERSRPSSARHDRAAHLHVDTDDQTHLDLWIDGDSDLQTEVERLVWLGATRVEWTYAEDAQHVVLADTEGNLFCVCA